MEQSFPSVLPAFAPVSETVRPVHADGLIFSTQPSPRLIEIMMRAFRDEPHNQWVFRNDHLKDQAFARYLSVYLSEIAKKGATFIMSAEKDSACVVGRSVKDDHDLSLAAMARMLPAVVGACTPQRLHRMMAMEHAISCGHQGMKHYPHLVFTGGIEPRTRSVMRISRYLRQTYPVLLSETADPRVAALSCRQGAIETGRAKPLFGGPEIIFLMYRSKQSDAAGSAVTQEVGAAA